MSEKTARPVPAHSGDSHAASFSGRRVSGRFSFWARPLRRWRSLCAVLLVSGVIDLPVRGGALVWHIHETLFGFVAAAMAGFLTTAVPQWTGAKPLAGPPLILLVLLWLAGRAAWLVSGALPGWLVAAIDIAFLPALCLALGASIVAARQWRNLPVILLLLILAGANAIIHLAVLGVWADGSMTGARLGLLTVIVLVSLIGGRIVPAFTRNALIGAGRDIGIPPRPRLDLAGNLCVAAAGAAIALDAAPPAAGAVALVAAILAAVRLAGWRGWEDRRIPLLWILHLGWLWVPAGLALYGFRPARHRCNRKRRAPCPFGRRRRHDGHGCEQPCRPWAIPAGPWSRPGRWLPPICC